MAKKKKINGALIIVVTYLAIVMFSQGGTFLGAVAIEPTAAECEDEREDSLSAGDACVSECFQMTSLKESCFRDNDYDGYSGNIGDYFFVSHSTSTCKQLYEDMIRTASMEKYQGFYNCDGSFRYLVDSGEGVCVYDVDCPIEYICVMEECVPSMGEDGCTDTDGIDYYTKGRNRVCTGGYCEDGDDYCTIDGVLVEYYCESGSDEGMVTTYDCPDGEACDDGRCIASTCTDTDGRDYYTKGRNTVCTGVDGCRDADDYCETSGMVIEYYCESGSNEALSESFDCPSDECSAGKCTPDPEPDCDHITSFACNANPECVWKPAEGCVPECVPDCSCKSNTCVGSTCPNGCGGTCQGTKTGGTCGGTDPDDPDGTDDSCTKEDTENCIPFFGKCNTKTSKCEINVTAILILFGAIIILKMRGPK